MTLDSALTYALASMAASTMAMAVRQLRPGVMRWLFGTSCSGAVIGVLAVLAKSSANAKYELALPFFLVAATLWMRWRHVDRDYVDGLLFGTLTGAISGAVLGALEGSSAALAPLAEGATAGFLTHIALFRTRRARAAHAVTVLIAVAAIHPLTSRVDVNWTTLTIAVGVVSLIAILATFVQWHLLKSELLEEARFGVFPENEVAGITNPLRRIQKFGWRDPEARREFVRLATELAIRKSRQRRMDESMARLHHVEVLKIRQVLGDVLQVERSVRRDHEQAAEESSMSDKMPSERASNSE